MNKTRVTFFILSMLISFAATAVPARKGVYSFTQPDGSTIRARLKGDEFYRQLTTIEGSSIILDKDGWYSYAYYTPDGRKLSSGVHVSDITASSPAAIAARTVPHAALNRKAAQMRELRSRLNTERASSVPATRAAAVKKRALIILAQFPDLKFKYNKSYFTSMLNGDGYSYNGACGSALEYFNAQFEGSCEFEFIVSDPVTLSKGYAYYGENDEDGHDKRPAEAVVEACRLVDPAIDFSQFDMDNDGEVDNVFIFVAGTDEAEGADEDHIWSHQWYVADGAGMKTRLDGKLINSYAMSTEISHDMYSWKEIFTTIGTFCHEYSHVLGLADMYDTDYEDSGGESDALWEHISLMDHGSYNNSGNTPPNYTSFELETVGLGRCLDMETGNFSLKPLSQEKVYSRIESDTPGEYWIFECRDNEGWDKYIGGNGLLIYHIDRSKRSAGYSDTYSMDMTAAMRWYYNEVNCWPSHQCADLVECVPNASSVSQVFWPNGNHSSFSKDSSPAFRHWSGKCPDISLLNIRRDGGEVSFTVAGPIAINKVEAFQDAAIVQWSMTGGSGTQSYITITDPSGRKTEKAVKPYYPGLYSYTFEGLNEKSTYKILVSTRSGGSGDSVDGEFTTKGYYSDGYPFIYLNSSARDAEGYFINGSQMPLRVFNARNASHVSWTFNSHDIEDDGSGYWTVPGEGVLKAYVDYNDGTTEIISKRIYVK